MSSDDIQRIAEGLTEAQRLAVRHWKAWAKGRVRYPTSQTFKSIRRKGFTETYLAHPLALNFNTRLTPLGLAVRSHLKDIEHG